ncbi:MAG: LuxR family transcriptional regulator [Pseudomonadota bacterium]
MNSKDYEAIDCFLRAVDKSGWPEEIWRAFVAFVRKFGASSVSYHHLPPPGNPHGEKIRIIADGLPEAWVRHYIRDQLYKIDPVAKASARASKPFLWGPLQDDPTLEPEALAYFAERKAQGIGNGMAIQVYGPGGRSGYIGPGVPEGLEDDIQAHTRELQWAAQVAHQTYCGMLQSTSPSPPALSGRERDVLTWLARGKSNSVIADILRISPHTVDAYVRRLFQKLGTNDRVSAAVAAISMGLILASD